MADFTTEWERSEFDSVPSLAEDMVYLLPGCDSVLIRKTLQASYRDFCKRGAALRTWRKIPLEHGHFHYPVAPVFSGEIDCVTQVLWAHSRVPVRGWRVSGDSPAMLEIPRHFSRHYVDETLPNIVWVQERENVGAQPVEVPNGDDERRFFCAAVMVEAVEIPHIGEERAPREFLQRYGDALVDGALARLFSMTAKPWTDAEQARQRGIAYANALSEARQRSMCGGPAANASSGFALDMSTMV